MLVAGVDIGNNTVEVALAEVSENTTVFISSGIASTTGVKEPLRISRESRLP